MSKLSKNFEENVARVLAENKVLDRKPSSEKELADALGVTPQAVSKTLKADARLSTVESYAKALRVSPARLLSGSQERLDPAEVLFEAARLLNVATTKGVDSPELRLRFLPTRPPAKK